MIFVIRAHAIKFKSAHAILCNPQNAVYIEEEMIGIGMALTTEYKWAAVPGERFLVPAGGEHQRAPGSAAAPPECAPG